MLAPVSLRSSRLIKAFVRQVPAAPADVCLIVEGCYPYVSGGVSSWLDWLMRSQPERRFSVVAILAKPPATPPKYPPPPNLVDLRQVILHETAAPADKAERLGPDAARLEGPLHQFMTLGGLRTLDELLTAMRPLLQRGLTAARFVRSREAYEMICRRYERTMPRASFIDFYWGWRSLVQSIFGTLAAEVPEARVYHAISTGYAGLYQAMASLVSGQPSIVTEHGIYTNERRMEIMLATWIRRGLRRRLSVREDIPDIDALWAQTFEAFSRTCYEASREITTLYQDNSLIQGSDGAPAEKRSVIPNGVDVADYRDLPRPAPGAQPTVALIGRVTPIKDIKTFIRAIDATRETIPNVRGLVIGPTEEDESYWRECVELVRQLALEPNLSFTGLVKIRDWLPEIHVMALTSLSEAQPLTILEAGAAGIPCVTTSVGACGEMILGAPGEEPSCGPGGALVGLVDPLAMSEAIITFLADPDMARRCGENLRARVSTLYRADLIGRQYSELYDRVGAPRYRRAG